MEEKFKICPSCNAEYFSHVAECRGCGVALVFPEEETVKAGSDDPFVCVAEAGADRAKDLVFRLKSFGIEAKVLKMNEAGCSSSAPYGVFVPGPLAPQAVKKIDDLWYAENPELRVMEERISQGLCPACGADTKSAVTECPDCGLNLGGGGGGGHSDCGSCS